MAVAIRSRGRLQRAARLCAALLLWTAAGAPGIEPRPAGEYEVKAAMLFNFSKFVEWPAAKLDRSPRFVVGVLGQDPMGQDLDRVLRDKSVAGKPVVVRRFERAEGTEACHILFVSAAESKKLPEIAASLEKGAVLTVGDSERFARSGGAVGFVIQDNRVRFEVNLSAAKRAGLTVSSKLLRLATVVGD